MDDLYKTIKALCDAKGVKPTKMAKLAGISPALISDLKYERKKTITLPTAQKIASVLEVAVEELLGEDSLDFSEKEKTPSAKAEGEAAQKLLGLFKKMDEDNQDLLIKQAELLIDRRTK